MSSRLIAWPLANDDNSRRIFNETSAALSALSAACPASSSRAFRLRCVMPQGTPEAISVYDTEPLKATLIELVDFDLLNSGAVRMSVGAVQVLTGNMQYFDTALQTIGPEHVMASGALPPGLPAHRDRRRALLGRRPRLQHAAANMCSNVAVRAKTWCIFQVDLFSARAACRKPCSISAQREKEIRYSSRTRLNTDIFRELQTIRRAIRQLRTEGAARALRQPRLATARQRELRRRGHHRAAHSPARGLLDAIERL